MCAFASLLSRNRTYDGGLPEHQLKRVTEYIHDHLEQRVEQAKQLLDVSELLIADVALQCGFSRQSHFGQWFRKLSGMTPKAYRCR